MDRVFKKIKLSIRLFYLYFRLKFVSEIPYDFAIPAYCSMLLRKRVGKLESISLRNFETRNDSILALISGADEVYKFPDFDWIVINTDDLDQGCHYGDLRQLSFSSRSGDLSYTCPDFVFDHWKQTQLDDYETVRKSLSHSSTELPYSEVLGWRGANTHPNRKKFIEISKSSTSIDAEFINWKKTADGFLSATNFVSLDDQPRKWRYLIDIEGRGYSGRLKLLLGSGRTVFIQDRPEKEWFFEHLVPWVHYVPVANDFSDLMTNLEKIKSDTVLEDKIIQASKHFVEKHLTRSAAFKRWRDLLVKST